MAILGVMENEMETAIQGLGLLPLRIKLTLRSICTVREEREALLSMLLPLSAP